MYHFAQGGHSQVITAQVITETANKHLIIGAGFVGLGMAQALKAADIPYDQVDASDDIGGNWHHGVYETAHLISSRHMTQFPVFPMPAHYPHFPSAQQMWEYLNAFTDRFDLRSQIELNCLVNYVRPIEHNLWEVSFANGEQRLYKGILLCNGHHWYRKFPQFKGSFNGEMIHSKDYKHPDQLRGKRVLIIGAGNSACDIAAEAARVGATSVLSMRESPWFLPKSFLGYPIGDFSTEWLPEWLQRLLMQGIIYLTFGNHKRYRLPQPKHRIFEKHPTLNNEVPYYLQHGRIIPCPEVKQLDGWEVEFVDAQRHRFDLIVCATGYEVVYPFLPIELQRVQNAVVKCYGTAFLDDYKGLYYLGWWQPRGGVGSLIGALAPLLVQFLQLQEEIKIPVGLALKHMGNPLADRHIFDGKKLIQRYQTSNRQFSQIAKRAHQIDAQYSEFYNAALPTTAEPTHLGATKPLTVS